MNTRFLAPSLRAAALATAFLAGPAATAQVWVPIITSSPPGTPAEVNYVDALSDAHNTWVEVKVHGFWRTPIVGPDGVGYQRIEVPGLGRIGQTGAPDLPVARTRIGVATDAPVVNRISVNAHTVVTFPGMTIYPTTLEEIDDPIDPSGDPGPGDPDGEPEKFVKDAGVYALPTPWPPEPATTQAAVGRFLGAIPSAPVEVFPMQWTPATKTLVVSGNLRIHYSHPGGLLPLPKITLDAAKFGPVACVNWPEVAPWIQADTTVYKGRYLIVTPQAYVATLEPLIDYRKACGYAVTVRTLESLPFVTCGEIRGAIAAWYSVGLPEYDHYCLLIGDDSVLPMCPSPTIEVKMGDDRYGSPIGLGDLDEEVFVGRMSVDNANDLKFQIAKVINYEIHAPEGAPYHRAMLAAHKEGAPGKYVGNCELVAGASYNVPPTFLKVYGSNAGIDNQDVSQTIENGLGLVSYRGHGTTNTWVDWNLLGEDFHKNDVVSLSGQNTLPVVWSFSCTNQNLPHSGGTTDCIGENWLEYSTGGGVAHYGSTTASGTSQNHVLQRRLFEAVYELSMTTHSHAIAFAEHMMNCEVPGLNSWMYLLLGDPAMKVRRTKVKKLNIVGPGSITANPNGQTLIFQALGGANPQPGVLISLYKPGLPGGPDEVLANAYTGTGGQVAIPIGPTSLGSMHWTGRDDEGNVAFGTIGVQEGPWTDLGDAKAGVQGKPLLDASGSLLPGTPMSLDLYKAAPSAMAVLFLGYADQPTPFVGGTLHAVTPPVAIAVQTLADGTLPIDVAAWPAGVPSGATLVFQYAIADPDASFNASLSNALMAVTP